MAIWTPEKVIVYKNEPLTWAKENFELKTLHPWQKEYLTDLPHYNYLALRSGNGVGKTFILTMTILWLLSTHPYIRIQCTAPSEGQLNQGLWAELALWLDKSFTLKQSIQWTATKLMMRGYESTWWAFARTAQTKAGSQAAESLQGVHAENNAAVIDEASGVDEGSMAAVLGMLATGRSKVVMAGNPIRKSGLFYDAFHKLETIFKTYHIPSNDYTKLDKKLVNVDFIEFIRGVYGEDSPAWHFKVLGEFPPDDSYQMFSPEKLEKLYDPMAIPMGSEAIYIGADISDGGDCESVFTARSGNVLLEQRAFRSLDSEANADALEIMIQEYRPLRVNIDAVGVGTGTLSILRRRGHKNVYAVKGNETPTEPIYLNMRSELYFKAAALVRNEIIKTRFMCERMKADLSGHYQDPRDDGLFSVISKAKMRKLKSVENSPDFSDSFVYSLYGDKQLLTRPKLGIGETAKILQINDSLRKKSYTKKSTWEGLPQSKSRFDF
jgi:phage terminase large subunit